MSTELDQIENRHSLRCSVEEQWNELERPFVASPLSLSMYVKAIKEQQAIYHEACWHVTTDMQILLVALRNAAGSNAGAFVRDAAISVGGVPMPKPNEKAENKDEVNARRSRKSQKDEAAFNT